MKNIDALIKSALLNAKQAFVRIPVFLQGKEEFIHSILQDIRNITFVSDEKINEQSLLWSQAKQWLGQELDTVVFDLRSGYDLNKLCALAGCVKGGNVVFFWLPEDISQSNNHFDKRLATLIARNNYLQLSPFGVKKANTVVALPKLSFHQLPTQDQLDAIDAIEKVLYGHRRRPLFITADRGRGKSSALGLAAAKLMMAAKKHILVSSPIYSNVEILFKHAAQTALHAKHTAKKIIFANESQLSFIAPDKLLIDKPSCDLLIIDEAASIPLPMLKEIAKCYSRVIFSSTEQGYEGSGKGFTTQFRKMLDSDGNSKREIKLYQPIRFAASCPLEQFLYKAFLFDLEPIEPKEGEVHYQVITQKQLIENESLLRQLFALLLSAHYQTSLNDLEQVLNQKSCFFVGAFVKHILVGILYAHQEGGFEPEFAVQIAKGKRRVRGHLLPQSLAQHSGFEQLLCTSILRVVRLAVLPSWQRQGIASQLIKEIESLSQQQGLNLLGASFSADAKLLDFWLKQNFSPVRLGVSRDAASGHHSLQLIKSLLSPPEWFESLQLSFTEHLQYQISMLYRDMSPCLAARLYRLSQAPKPLSKICLMQVQKFTQKQLGADHVGASLHAWYCKYLAKNSEEKCLDKTEMMIFAWLIQRHSWQELAKQYGFTGRKQLESEMRLWIKQQLSNDKIN